MKLISLQLLEVLLSLEAAVADTEVSGVDITITVCWHRKQHFSSKIKNMAQTCSLSLVGQNISGNKELHSFST